MVKKAQLQGSTNGSGVAGAFRNPTHATSAQLLCPITCKGAAAPDGKQGTCMAWWRNASRGVARPSLAPSGARSGMRRARGGVACPCSHLRAEHAAPRDTGGCAGSELTSSSSRESRPLRPAPYARMPHMLGFSECCLRVAATLATQAVDCKRMHDTVLARKRTVQLNPSQAAHLARS